MNPKNIIWCVFLMLFFAACSKDKSDAEQVEVVLEIPNFQLIGEDEESIYWHVYDSGSKTATTTNLTQQDNLDRFYISLRQVAATLSFFSFLDGNFSLFQKNTNTSGTLSIQNFISVSGERSLIWGTTSESQIFMAYYSPRNSEELGVRTLDIETGSFVDTPLASNVFDTTEPLYFNQRLFVAYQDNTNQYNMIVFDTENRMVIRTFNFEDKFPSLLIDENGHLVIITGREGSFVRETFDVVNMELLESKAFNLIQFLNVGPLQAYQLNNKLYYLFELVQPSEVPFAPAVFDFETGESSVVDIVSISNTAKEQLAWDIVPTAFGFNTTERIFLMGYADASAEFSLTGGILIITEQGELIDVVELPFVPTYFIKS